MKLLLKEEYMPNLQLEDILIELSILNCASTHTIVFIHYVALFGSEVNTFKPTHKQPGTA